MADQLEDVDVAWFNRTAHCGGCGQPGDYCQCTARRPCGCRHLHVMGSGREPGALDTFTEVSADQEGLF